MTDDHPTLPLPGTATDTPPGTARPGVPDTGTPGSRHRTTSMLVGLAALLRPGPPAADGSGWVDVLVGGVFAAEDAADAVRSALARATGGPARRVSGASAALRRRTARLAARGAVERQRGHDSAAGALAALTDALAASPIVDRVVDVQLDRVLRPLVALILDDVLVRLEAEPERVRSLIRGQRESMVDELVTRFRAGAMAGDAVVDRLTTRVFRRRAEPSEPARDRPVPDPGGSGP